MSEDAKQRLVDLVQEGINYLQEHGHYPEAADQKLLVQRILDTDEGCLLK